MRAKARDAATPGFAKEVPAAKQIGPVVDVATVGGASAGADNAATSKLRQVVRHEIRRLPDQLHELSDRRSLRASSPSSCHRSGSLSRPRISGGAPHAITPLHQTRLIQCKSMEVPLRHHVEVGTISGCRFHEPVALRPRIVEYLWTQ